MEKNNKIPFKILFVTIILTMTTFSVFAIADDKNTDNRVFVSYSFEQPTLETVAIGDTVYDKVIMQGAQYIGKPGSPELPAKGVYILLPLGSKIDDIEVISSEKVSLGSNLRILPVEEPLPLSQIKTDSSAITCDETIYTLDEEFPGDLFTKVGTYYFRGCQILVGVISPVQYVPSTGELSYYKDITITVNTEEIGEIHPLFRGPKDIVDVMNMVDNPSIISTYLEEQDEQLDPLTEYDLVIITTNALENAFQELADRHTNDGLFTTIKTVEDIYSEYSGVDNQQKIRNFIIDAYNNWNIEYVLIGGDDNVVPARDLWVRAWEGGSTTYMPSDLYYACLDGTYNYDGDGKWGEPTDGDGGGDVDLIAEVYVGRACVGNAIEVNHFVDKTIAYMDVADYYLIRALMVGENLDSTPTWGGDYMDELIDGSSANGYTTVGIPSDIYDIDTLYERDGGWSKSNLIDRITNGVHFINHLGHSSPSYNMKLSNSDIDSLTNDDLCFVYSQGCDAGSFDGYDCIAEHFTVKTDYGAFAGIWNARSGWYVQGGTDGPSQHFHREFWNAVFDESISGIGRANQDSKEDNLWRISGSCMRWCYYQLNLFGDPTVVFELYDNDPPERPDQPEGITEGEIGIDYTYTTNAVTDPEGDDVQYLFDWDDGTNSGWVDTPSAGHTWTKRGDYEVKVKAKDIWGAPSDWSEPLPVTIIGPEIEIGNVRGGLCVNAKIDNNGDADAFNVNWSVSVKGGILDKINSTSDGTLENLDISNGKTVRGKLVFGLGKVEITVTARLPDLDPIEKTFDGFVFGPFVMGVR